jgi:hypothetical protein
MHVTDGCPAKNRDGQFPWSYGAPPLLAMPYLAQQKPQLSRSCRRKSGIVSSTSRGNMLIAPIISLVLNVLLGVAMIMLARYTNRLVP